MGERRTLNIERPRSNEKQEFKPKKQEPTWTDFLGQSTAMIEGMPDQVRHDRNPLGLVRHSGARPPQ
jgi:hypothetical protein